MCLEEIAVFAELELCSARWIILSRSVLLDRLTEVAATAALLAVTGPVNAQMVPAMKELKRPAATILLRL